MATDASMPSKNAQKLRQIERQLFFSKEANTTTAVRPYSRQRWARVGAMARSAQHTLHCLFCYLRDIKSRLGFLLFMIRPLSSFLHVGKGQ